MEPLFTIIVPADSGYFDFLGPLLSSIANQSFRNFECLVLSYGKIGVSHFLPDERFVEVIQNKGRGVAVQRNAGIERARGDYILFCDSDDLLDVNALATMEKGILEDGSPDFICLCPTRIAGELGKTQKSKSEFSTLLTENAKIRQVFFGRYLRSNPYAEIDAIFILDGIWGRAYKKEVIVRHSIRFIEDKIQAEDALFENEIAQVAKSALFVFYYGYYWRPNSHSLMHRWGSQAFAFSPFAIKLTSQLACAGSLYIDESVDYLGQTLFRNISRLSAMLRQTNSQKEKQQIRNAAKGMMPRHSIARDIFAHAVRKRGKIRIAVSLIRMRMLALAVRALFC